MNSGDTDPPPGSRLGEALFRATIRAVLELIPVGKAAATFLETLRDPFSDALWQWLQQHSKSDQNQALKELSSLAHDRAKEIVRNEMTDHAAAKPHIAAVADTLAAVPMTAAHELQAMQLSGNHSAANCLTRTPDPKRRLARLLPEFRPMFSPGHPLLNSDYVLTSLLGQGGLGEVWLAHHRYLPSKAPVAIKFCRTPRLRELLRHEAEVINLLGPDASSHGIVALYHTNFEAGIPYLVYEYVPGGTLLDWIALYPGLVPIAKVTFLLERIARALAYAHAQRIVHRDLKPTNVLIGAQDTVKLTDWSIALAAERPQNGPASPAEPHLVADAATPPYRDPGLHRGSPAAPAQDIYSFGVLACQLLLGDVTVVPRLGWRKTVAARYPALPAQLLDVIERCVVDESSRIQDGSELLAELRHVADNPSSVKKPLPDPAAAAAAAAAAAGAASPSPSPTATDPLPASPEPLAAQTPPLTPPSRTTSHGALQVLLFALCGAVAGACMVPPEFRDPTLLTVLPLSLASSLYYRWHRAPGRYQLTQLALYGCLIGVFTAGATAPKPLEIGVLVTLWLVAAIVGGFVTMLDAPSRNPRPEI